MRSKCTSPLWTNQEILPKEKRGIMIACMKLQSSLTTLAIVLPVAVLSLGGCATSVSAEVEEPAVYTDPLDQSIQAYDRISAAIILGDPRLAIQEYERARLENPEDPDTQVLLSRLYIAAGDMEQAREILAEIPRDSAAYVDAALSLALIERSQGDRDAELGLLDEVLRLDENNLRANAALGEIFLEDKNFQQAELRFEKALESDPNDFVALQGLGNSYLRSDKNKEALDVFTRAIEEDSEYSYVYVDRSRAHMKGGNSFDALEDMNKALELDAENGWNYLDRARIYARTGNFEAARDDFGRAIEFNPHIFMNYAYRGQMSAYLGDYAPALDDYRMALKMRPDYYPAYGFAGALYYIEGEYESALFFLNKAYEEEPQKQAYILFAANAAFLSSRAKGRSYLQENVGKIQRDSLLYEVARYYLSGSDMTVLHRLPREENRTVQAFSQFFMALAYLRNGQVTIATTLLGSTEQEILKGSPEGIVKEWIIYEHIE